MTRKCVTTKAEENQLLMDLHDSVSTVTATALCPKVTDPARYSQWQGLRMNLKPHIRMKHLDIYWKYLQVTNDHKQKVRLQVNCYKGLSTPFKTKTEERNANSFILIMDELNFELSLVKCELAEHCLIAIHTSYDWLM